MNDSAAARNVGVPEIGSLTGLRFVAAMCVALTHYAINAHYTVFGLRFSAASLGMELFFVLSGFVVHYVYASSFASSWGQAVRRFSIARFARLYPLFFLFFVFFILYRDLGHYISDPKIALSYATLTSTWWYWQVDGKTLMSQNYGWSWSVATEWFFYVCYVLGLYRIGRIRRPGICVGLLVGVLLCGYALMWLLYRYLPQWEPIVLQMFPGAISWKADQGNSFFHWLTYTSPYLQVFEFIAGCLVAQLYVGLRDHGVGRVLNEFLFWVGAAWIMVILCIFLKISTDGVAIWESKSFFFGYLWILHKNFLLVPGIVLVILALALGDCSARKLFAAAPVVFLGEISYSIYLGHPMVVSFAGIDQTFSFPTICLGISMAMVCFFAAGLYSCYELPMKRAVRGVLERIVPRRGAPSPNLSGSRPAAAREFEPEQAG